MLLMSLTLKIDLVLSGRPEQLLPTTARQPSTTNSRKGCVSQESNQPPRFVSAWTRRHTTSSVSQLAVVGVHVGMLWMMWILHSFSILLVLHARTGRLDKFVRVPRRQPPLALFLELWTGPRCLWAG